MARCAPTASATGCQCAMEDSDCFVVTGSGSAENPYVVDATIDPNPDNWLECGLDGLGVIPPDVFLNPPRCQVNKVTSVSIGNSTIVTIPFSTIVYQAGGTIWTASDPTRFSAPVSGLYGIKVQTTWQDDADAGVRTTIRHQPSGLAVASSTFDAPAGSGQHGRQNLSWEYELNAGEYFVVEVFHNSGSTVFLEESGTQPAQVAMRYLTGLS